MRLDVYDLCQCLKNIHAYKVNQLTTSLTFRQPDKQRVQPSDDPPSQLSYRSTAASPARTLLGVLRRQTIFLLFYKSGLQRLQRSQRVYFDVTLSQKNGRKSGSSKHVWEPCRSRFA